LKIAPVLLLGIASWKLGLFPLLLRQQRPLKMLELGSIARAHMPEILRALAESPALEQDGMQASSHPRLFANCPASLTPQDRNKHAGV